MLIRLLRFYLRPYRKPLAFLLVLQLAQTLATLYLPTLPTARGQQVLGEINCSSRGSGTTTVIRQPNVPTEDERFPC